MKSHLLLRCLACKTTSARLGIVKCQDSSSCSIVPFLWSGPSLLKRYCHFITLWKDWKRKTNSNLQKGFIFINWIFKGTWYAFSRTASVDKIK